MILRLLMKGRILVIRENFGLDMLARINKTPMGSSILSKRNFSAVDKAYTWYEPPLLAGKRATFDFTINLSLKSDPPSFENVDRNCDSR